LRRGAQTKEVFANNNIDSSTKASSLKRISCKGQPIGQLTHTWARGRKKNKSSWMPTKIGSQQKQSPEEGIPEGGPIPLHRDTTINLKYTQYTQNQKYYINIHKTTSTISILI